MQRDDQTASYDNTTVTQVFMLGMGGCYFLTGAAWCSVPYLPKGGAVAFSFTVQVAANAPDPITNTAFVDWNKQVTELDETNNSVTITTRVFSP